MPSFPHLSHLVRCRAVFLTKVFDFIIAIFVVQFATFCLFGLLYYYFFIFKPMFPQFFCRLLIFIETSFIFYAVWHCSKIFLFLVHTFHLVLYVWIAQQKAEHKTLETLISSQSKTRIFRSQLAIFTQTYAHLHLRLVRSIITCNKEYISPLLLLYLLTMSPLNVHSIAVIGLKKAVPFQVKALLVVNTSLQIVNALLAFWPLLRVVGPVNGTAHRYFYRAQPHLKENDLSRLKLKVMTYHDVLTCAGGEKRAVAFTVGPLGPLTPNAVVEVIRREKVLLKSKS